MKRIFPILSSALFPLTIGSLFAFSACTGPDHSKRIEQVDSLQKRLRNVEERLKNVDTGGALKLQKVVKEQIRIFKDHFERDSMGEELFNALDDHRRTKKALKGYRRDLRTLFGKVKETREHLKDLKKDLEEGYHTKKKANSYIQDEKKVMDHLERSVEKLEKKTRAAFKNHERYAGKLKEKLSLPDSVEWPHLEKQ